jgi:hypothetical protein
MTDNSIERLGAMAGAIARQQAKATPSLDECIAYMGYLQGEMGIQAVDCSITHFIVGCLRELAELRKPPQVVIHDTGTEYLRAPVADGEVTDLVLRLHRYHHAMHEEKGPRMGSELMVQAAALLERLSKELAALRAPVLEGEVFQAAALLRASSIDWDEGVEVIALLERLARQNAGLRKELEDGAGEDAEAADLFRKERDAAHKRIAALEADCKQGWEAFYALRKAVARDKYPELTNVVRVAGPEPRE